MLVREFMSENVVTVTSDKSMLEVRELMRSKDMRRLPVIDDIRRVVGILTDSDISRTSPTEATTLSKHEANYILGRIKVKDIMTRSVITIRDNAGIEDAAYMLYKNKINALPVLNEDGRLCGIITDSDVFRAFVDLMGLAKNSTRITLDVKDKIGVMAEIGGMFRDNEINIISIVARPYDEDAPEGHSEITISADLSKHGLGIIEEIREAGYEVVDITTVSSR